MRFYHGTTQSGLTELHPAGENRPLYLTDSFAYSLFYLRDREIDFVTCGVGPDGKVRYDEKFPDQLRILYQNRSGWVYEAEADAEPGRVSGIFTTPHAVSTLSARFIPDVYQAILDEIERGNVILLSYDETTPEQRQLNQQGIAHMLQTMPNMPEKRLDFLREHFPDAWNSTLRLVDVDEDNWRLNLSVSSEQQRFVAAMPVLLARAYAYRNYNSRAFVVQLGDLALGAGLYYDCPELNAYDFSQLFIDQRYQRRGFGKAAARLALEEMKRARRYEAAILCYVDGNDAARRLYAQLGFSEIDRNEDEIIMKMNLQ